MIFATPQEFLRHLNAKFTRYRLMGLDLGAKKVGMAFYDSSIKLSLPLKVLQASELEKIRAIIKEHNIDGLVVGISIDEKGNVHKERQKFNEDLLKKINVTGLPTVLIDERFTSKLASIMLKEAGMRRKKRDQLDDAVAAQLIINTLLTYEVYMP